MTLKSQIGTPECFASSGPCDETLNRCQDHGPVSFVNKPPYNIVEAIFTRESGVIKG